MDAQAAADAKRSLAVYWRAVITRQIVPDTPVSLIRVLSADLLYQSSQPPVCHRAGAGSAGTPLVISGTGNLS